MAADDLNWIIPVSAAVQAVATVILVGVTARYVRLTRSLVETSRQQLSDARAILEAQTGIGRARLAALTKRLLDTLEGLPPGGIPQNHLRRSGMWSSHEEDRLLDLATAIGPPFADRVSGAVAALAWIRHLQARIQALPERHGYGTDQKEEAAYAENRGRATTTLRGFMEALPS